MKNVNNRNSANIFDTSFNTTNKNDTDVESLCRFERVETFELTPIVNNEKSLIEKSFHYKKNNLNMNNLKVIKKNKSDQNQNSNNIKNNHNGLKNKSKSKVSITNKSNRFSFNNMNSFNEYMKENSFKNKISIKDEFQVRDTNYSQINDSINEEKIKPMNSKSKSTRQLTNEYYLTKGVNNNKKQIGNKIGLKSKNVFEINKNELDRKKKPALPNFKKKTVSSKQKKQSNYNSLNTSDILMNAIYAKKNHNFKPRMLNSSLSQSQSRLDSSFKTKIIKSSSIPVLTDLKEIKRYISSETFDKYSLNSFLTKNTRKSINSQRSYRSNKNNDTNKRHFSPTLKSYISEKSKFTKVSVPNFSKTRINSQQSLIKNENSDNDLSFIHGKNLYTTVKTNQEYLEKIKILTNRINKLTEHESELQRKVHLMKNQAVKEEKIRVVKLKDKEKVSSKIKELNIEILSKKEKIKELKESRQQSIQSLRLVVDKKKEKFDVMKNDRKLIDVLTKQIKTHDKNLNSFKSLKIRETESKSKYVRTNIIKEKENLAKLKVIEKFKIQEALKEELVDKICKLEEIEQMCVMSLNQTIKNKATEMKKFKNELKTQGNYEMIFEKYRLNDELNKKLREEIDSTKINENTTLNYTKTNRSNKSKKSKQISVANSKKKKRKKISQEQNSNSIIKVDKYNECSSVKEMIFK